MLDIETTKQLLEEPEMSDEEAEQIRNEMRTLAEIVIDSYLMPKNIPRTKREFKRIVS